MKKLESILLIDDDEITNFINEHLLQEMSVATEILIATNGKEGLDLIQARCQDQKSCPDLILLDIKMPVMNGFEFLEEYQNMDVPNRPQTVVVMLTSSSNSKDIEQANQSDIATYINKPLTEQKISTIITEYFSEDTV